MKNDRKISLSTKFILASILLHLLFMVTLRFSPSSLFTPPKYETVELELIDAEKPTSEVQPPLQIVQQNERAVNEDENKKAKYLSVQNHSVLKETVAEKKGEFKNAQKSGSQGTGQQQQEKNAQAAAKPRQAEAASKPEQDSLFKDLTKKYNSKNMFENIEKKNQQNAQQASAGSPGETSQTSDYLKGKDPGLETLLNTREYKYYTYFNRIRRKLSEHWEPKVKERMTKMFRQGRTIASTAERITKLLIVLNNSGILMKVQVLSDSGVHDLDEAAIDAFRAAAPFPHPPQGIVDAEGTIKIRWDFILE